jgi:hypothetical protein
MKIESTVSWRETGMNFNEYQVLAEQTAIYDNEFYPVASLMVEAAELADSVCKACATR